MSLPTSDIHGALSAGIDEESVKQFRHLSVFLKTVKHYFGGFHRMFGSISDPRNPELIIYPLSSLFLPGC